MDKDRNIGLNAKNRNFILLLIIALLLFLGPTEPYGVVVRYLYLIIIPLLTWFILSRYGCKLEIDATINDRLTRALYGIVAGLLLMSAYISYTAKYHTECTQRVQTRDGQECVGDYITVKGKNEEGMIVSLIFAGLSFYFAVKKESKEID